jgi:hypothetical protein
MATLIIPCAGKSSRYPDLRPKWLLTHPDGQLMIEKAVKPLFKIKFIKKYIITITKEINQKYKAKIILEQIFKKKIKILILNKPTKSASETIYETIKRLNIVNGQLLIKDSDCFIKINNNQIKKLKKRNFIFGLGLDKFSHIRNIHQKSFIKINNKKKIIDIVEKKIISSLICVGLYSFSSVKSFVSSYKTCCKIYKINKNELFVSIIARYLINQNYIFDYFQCKEYEDYGTFEDWLVIRNKYRSFFVDLDGVIFVNKGKYGLNNWNTKNYYLKKNISTLKKIHAQGSQIIFCSSRSKNQYNRLYAELKKLGFLKFKLILDIYHSQRIIINDFTNSNPSPSAIAINLERNHDTLDKFIQ